MQRELNLAEIAAVSGGTRSDVIEEITVTAPSIRRPTRQDFNFTVPRVTITTISTAGTSTGNRAGTRAQAGNMIAEAEVSADVTNSTNNSQSRETTVTFNDCNRNGRNDDTFSVCEAASQAELSRLGFDVVE